MKKPAAPKPKKTPKPKAFEQRVIFKLRNEGDEMKVIMAFEPALPTTEAHQSADEATRALQNYAAHIAATVMDVLKADAAADMRQAQAEAEDATKN